MAVAQEADERGRPAEALDQYRRAVELYRGDYLAGAPDPEWGEFERVRLRSAFVRVAVRAGELLLGHREVDEAFRLATRAAEAEPYFEAAHRLQARALDRAGDRAGGRRHLVEVMARLAAEDLEPEPETLALVDSLTRPTPR